MVKSTIANNNETSDKSKEVLSSDMHQKQATQPSSFAHDTNIKFYQKNFLKFQQQVLDSFKDSDISAHPSNSDTNDESVWNDANKNWSQKKFSSVCHRFSLTFKAEIRSQPPGIENNVAPPSEEIIFSVIYEPGRSL